MSLALPRRRIAYDARRAVPFVAAVAGTAIPSPDSLCRSFDRIGRAIRQIIMLEFELLGLFEAPDRDAFPKLRLIKPEAGGALRPDIKPITLLPATVKVPEKPLISPAMKAALIAIKARHGNGFRIPSRKPKPARPARPPKRCRNRGPPKLGRWPPAVFRVRLREFQPQIPSPASDLRMRGIGAWPGLRMHVIPRYKRFMNRARTYRR